MKHIISIVVFLILASTSFSFGGMFDSPDCYEDCITEAMKGVKSDLAARAIMDACREKFPKEKDEKISLDLLAWDELQKIKGRGGIMENILGNLCFSGVIYNGNENISVEEMVVVLMIENGAEKVTQKYLVKVNASPLEKKDFQKEIMYPFEKRHTKLIWDIEKARGREVD